MKELLDKIMEFCSDNYILIAQAGGILLVLILVGIFISNKVKDKADDRPREFFLEGEYDTLIRETALTRKGGEAAEEQAADEVPAQVRTVDEEEAEVPLPESAEHEDSDLCPELEDLLKEEYQPVHININIGRGQVKIGCDEDGRVTCMIEGDQPELPETADEAEAGAEKAETWMEEAETGAEEAAEAGSRETGSYADGREELLSGQGNIVLEKINIVKSAPVRKFGPDNFNTGRSGRVFTEEELKQQIKD